MPLIDNRRARFNVVRDKGIVVDGCIARVGVSKRATINSQEGGGGVGIRGEEGVLRKLHLCKVFVEGNRRGKWWL